jgi:hypothetical protein
MTLNAPGEVALVYSPDLRRQFRLARERRDLSLSIYDELQEPISDLEERRPANRRRPADVEKTRSATPP